MEKNNIADIMVKIKQQNTPGYFYQDNCRLNYSDRYGWYCKDFIDNKMVTYNITEEEAYTKLLTA